MELRKVFSAVCAGIIPILVMGCFPDGDGGYSTGETILVAATDYNGKNFLYNLDTIPGADYFGDTGQADLGTDPQLDPVLPDRANLFGGPPVVVFREGWSALSLGRIAVINQWSLNVDYVFSANNGTDPANPQDVLYLSASKAYVTRFEPPYNDILIVNPQDGSTQGTIDMSGLGTNPDGLPRPTKMIKAGDTVYVLMQNFSLFFPFTYGAGRIAAVDPGADAIDHIIDLATTNPNTVAYLPFNNSLIVASLGDWADPALSGIELVDLATQQSSGVVVSGSALPAPGFIGNVACLGAGRAVIVSSAADWSGDYAYPLDITGGTVGAHVYWSFYVADLGAGGGVLHIADNAGSRLVIMETTTFNEVHSVDLAVPPQSVMYW
jgi:hypothetical protein